LTAIITAKGEKMLGTDSNHCQIVSESLQGQRPVDEQSLLSIDILSERLDRLKKLGGLFSKIEFSADATRLMKHQNAVAVG